MSDKKLKVKIIAESGVILQKEYSYILVPGTGGEIGIYPEHVNIISTLKIGKVVLRDDLEDTTILVDGGFVNVHNNTVTILANEAAETHKLVESEILQAEKDAQEKLSQELPPEDLIRAEKQLRFAQLKRQSLH